MDLAHETARNLKKNQSFSVEVGIHFVQERKHKESFSLSLS